MEYDPDDQEGDWSNTSFPAREIYERTLPSVVEALSDVFYHPGSPWGGKDTTDGTVGDCHRWDVWHGQQLPYQQWDKLGARFISEFGGFSADFGVCSPRADSSLNVEQACKGFLTSVRSISTWMAT